MLIKLINAIQKESIDKVKELLEKGVDVNAYEDDHKITPLHFVAQKNTFLAYQIAFLLLKAGADPLAKNCDDQTPVDIALIRNNFKMAYILRKET